MTLYIPFNRIILHHTGGAYKANKVDLAAYHTVTNGDGEVVPGIHPYEANRAGQKLVEGRYAAHCKGLNSGSLGKALAAMGGKTTWADAYTSKFFPTTTQVDRYLLDVAEVAVKFTIPVTRRTILSHAEVQTTLGVKQRQKWDFDYSIKGDSKVARNAVALGDDLRAEIAQLIENLGKSIDRTALILEAERRSEELARVTLRRGSTGELVRDLQKFLGVKVDGQFGPITEAAVIKLQKKHQLLPNGEAGPMTLALMRKPKTTAL